MRASRSDPRIVECGVGEGSVSNRTAETKFPGGTVWRLNAVPKLPMASAERERRVAFTNTYDRRPSSLFLSLVLSRFENMHNHGPVVRSTDVRGTDAHYPCMLSRSNHNPPLLSFGENRSAIGGHRMSCDTLYRGHVSSVAVFHVFRMDSTRLDSSLSESSRANE